MTHGRGSRRVPPTRRRPFRGRMRLLVDSGQLADAERLVKAAAEDSRNDRTALLVMLVPILTEQGRTDEAVGRIEERWEHLNEKGEGAMEPAIQLLWQHIELTSTATPVETLRASIDQAGRLAPDDDRVWLGRANLAIRTGAHDEAGRWLDACRRRRPEDVPVWRARLELGIATHRIEDVGQAVTHLPDAYWTPARRHQLAAWLASASGRQGG